MATTHDTVSPTVFHENFNSKRYIMRGVTHSRDCSGLQCLGRNCCDLTYRVGEVCLSFALYRVVHSVDGEKSRMAAPHSTEPHFPHDPVWVHYHDSPRAVARRFIAP
jgi:hypothetical protein